MKTLNEKVILGLGVIVCIATFGILMSSTQTTQQSVVKYSTIGGEKKLWEAFQERRSDIFVESYGTVVKILSDDLKGSKHQRFILKLSTGQTLLISHNIDLAKRIERLKEGDGVTFRGEYEWNEKGGVVHWTHHDPQGHRKGGWLEYQGRRYY